MDTPIILSPLHTLSCPDKIISGMEKQDRTARRSLVVFLVFALLRKYSYLHGPDQSDAHDGTQVLSMISPSGNIEFLFFQSLGLKLVIKLATIFQN